MFYRSDFISLGGRRKLLAFPILWEEFSLYPRAWTWELRRQGSWAAVRWSPVHTGGACELPNLGLCGSRARWRMCTRSRPGARALCSRQVFPRGPRFPAVGTGDHGRHPAGHLAGFWVHLLRSMAAFRLDASSSLRRSIHSTGPTQHPGPSWPAALSPGSR